jgi:Leucine-rich repeat (LRR) protein
MMSDMLERVVNPYNATDSLCRDGLLIKGEWQEGYKEYILENKITALYLNYAKGWKCGDYSFLSELTSIEELNIISSSCSGLESIEKLSNLEELSISCDSKSVVDFQKLKKLKKCYLYWWKGVKNIFKLESLTDLYLDKLKLNDYSIIGELKNIEALKIYNSVIDDISFLNKLEKLIHLELANCKKINDFENIGCLKKLKRLSIAGNKNLYTIDFLSGLSELEILDLSNDGVIKSIKPLMHASSLKAFSFADNTDIEDGDLSCLAKLPKLSMLMFASRRHYSHKLIKKWNWNNLDYPDTLLDEKVKK